MADSIQKAMRLAARGFRDALVGALTVYQPESEGRSRDDTSSPSHRSTERMSTLARRRAESLRYTEVRQQR